ncbi:MAG TPA: hypothetical protein VH054_05815 [Polyangiaceae bacterium]|jgi:peptidoglycan/LPS O-acetylase OafA/YrhL|nr:hypothetical protein [Polyangiaceae bacterium]
MSMKRSRFGWWYAIVPPIAVFVVIPATLVLAFWPTPSKYPLVLPAAVIGAGMFAVHRYKNEHDDFGASLAVVAAFAGLAAMTLAHFLDLGVGATFGVWAALLVVPFVALVLMMIMSGAASDPRFDD